MDRTEFFKASKNVAKVQVVTLAGKPALFLIPAGMDASKKGDRAMRFTYHAEADKLVWESGKGSVSDACFGHCTALCEEAKAAGMTVVEE